MGKLLKLIAQEEFEKDPFQIRNRAVKLFKRYAHLPDSSIQQQKSQPSSIITDNNSVTHELPRFASMTLGNTEESQDLQSLRAENTKLRQKIKVSFNIYIYYFYL